MKTTEAGAEVLLLVAKKGYPRAGHFDGTTMFKVFPVGTRGQAENLVFPDRGTYYILLDNDYFTLVDPEDYRVLTPLDLLAECGE